MLYKIITMKQVYIEKIPYKQYSNSFLDTVALSLYFDSTESKSDFMSRLKEFTATHFNLNIKNEGEFEGIRITKEDKSINFFLSLGCAMVEISGSSYQNFIDSQLPHLDRLIEFSKKVAVVDYIKNISIRKLNTWDFKGDEGKNPSLKWVYDKIFSADLVGSLSKDDLNEKERLISNFQKFIFQDGDYTIKVRTAYIQNSKDKNYTRLILDTECLSSVEKKSMEELTGICKKMNKRMYDVYHWCVTDEVINMMNK